MSSPLLERHVALRGSQLPRIESTPAGVASSGDDVADLCAAVGVDLDPWQRHVLRGALAEDERGDWSAFEVGVVVPRQNGKGEILLARQLGGLFMLGEELILHSAHEYKTAAEAFQRIKILIENTDDLIKRCKKPRTANGEQGIELLNGNRLRFVARSGGSGRGFSADCVILDEAYELGPAEMAAMLPTLSSRPNPQVWYASSAGMEGSSQLRAVRERGIRGDDVALAYFEWSADPRAEMDDREAWAQANPALGIRISPAFVERERAAMPEMEFGRERLGIWDDAGRLAVIPLDVWNELIDRTSKPSDPVTFAIGTTPERSWSSVAVASRSDLGTWHVEVVENRRGAAWVVDRCVELNERWRPFAFRVDSGGPAASLIPALMEAGVPVEKIGATEYGQACGAFYDAVTESKLRHIDQGPLTAAVQAARKRPLRDAWAWHRQSTDTDITPLEAVTLAMHGHAQHLGDAKPKPRTNEAIFI